MAEELQERRDRIRFRAEMILLVVAVGTMGLNTWQIYLTREQFKASEQHYRDDHDAADRQRREDLRPLLAINTPALSTGATGALNTKEWDGRIEIVNVGRGLALDVEVEWLIDMNPPNVMVSGRVQIERTEPRHLAAGQVATLTRIPREIAEIADTKRLKDAAFTGRVRMKAQTLDKVEAVSEQTFKVVFDSGAVLTRIEFGDLIPRPVDWTMRSVFQ